MAGTPRTTGAQPFQMTVQHPDQKPVRRSFKSADTARGWARRAWESGHSTPEVAKVVRKHDGAVIWDGPNGVDMPLERWNDGVPAR